MQKISLRFIQPIALTALMAISVSLLSSCQPEGCTDPMSDNYDPKAKKNDGTCVPWRDKFVANYTGKNACAGSLDEDVTVVITLSGTTDDGIVVSIPSQDLLFTAKVTAQNGFAIENQSIPYKGSTVNISGTGLLKNSAEITISYNLSSGPLNVPCSVSGNQL